MGKRSAVVAQKRAARSALVSVIVTTWNRPELIVQRCIPSILAQTHSNLDIHIVGDGCSEETLNKMGDLPSLFRDGRLRFTNRPRPEYPPGELDAWHISGSYAANYGLDTAKGQYVCGIGDDDQYAPEFVAKMLDALVKDQAGLAYCVSEIIRPDGGSNGFLGVEYPPRFAGQSGGEFMWRKNDVRLDVRCWEKGLPNDWDYISRVIATGVKVTHVRERLYFYFPARHVPRGHPAF